MPLLLAPVIVPKPWGGHRLHALGRHDDPETPVGESWEVADLPTDATTVPDPVSRVVGGPYDGWALSQLLTSHRTALLGGAATSDEGRFPLLVKTLDAAESLSVQVHPPRSLDPSRFKLESWVVLDADEDAQLLLGVRDGVTLDDVRAAIGSEDLLNLVRRMPARPGDVVHLPAGTIHALGAGVLVAEVQTPSDVTHRLWDWPERHRTGRELHLEEGLQSIEAGWDHNLTVTPVRATDGVLVTTSAYRLEHATLGDGDGLAAAGEAGSPRVVIVLAGGLTWRTPHDEPSVGCTETVLLPAASTTPLTATAAGATVLVAVPRTADWAADRL